MCQQPTNASGTLAEVMNVNAPGNIKHTMGMNRNSSIRQHSTRVPLSISLSRVTTQETGQLKTLSKNNELYYILAITAGLPSALERLVPNEMRRYTCPTKDYGFRVRRKSSGELCATIS